MRAWLLASCLLAASGCVTPTLDEADVCEPPELTLLHAETTPEGLVPRAPGEPVSFLYWSTNPTNATLEIWTSTLPDPEGALDPRAPGEPVSSPGIRHAVGPGELSFGGFAHPVDETQDWFWFQTETADPSCATTRHTPHRFNLTAPQESPRAEAGKGVLVHTAGFWTNGTSFYTNMDRVHEHDGIPKGYVGEYGGGEPLKVYVYEESTDEVPPRYERAGFVPTIRGFNEALKGIPTTAPRIVYIAPEDAYTREGREDHALYGDPLVFYIEALEVVDLPCEVPEPVCDVPNAPPPAAHPTGVALE